MIGVVGFDIPIVFFDLDPNPFLPAAAQFTALRRVGQPAPPPRAETVGSVLRAFG
jgi:hypothetical protein